MNHKILLAMKKSMLFRSFLMLAIFPLHLFAQEIKLPTVEIAVSQDLVPAKVKNAVLNDFGIEHAPFAWVNNNSVFNTWEWSQIIDPSLLEVYAYSFSTKASNGSTLNANYTADGKLLNAREDIRNFKPSLNIIRSLVTGEYSGWSVMKDHQIIRHFSDGSVKERTALVITRGNEKKTILLDENGRMLADKDGAHMELADLYK
jgi:hypothetical protein